MKIEHRNTISLVIFTTLLSSTGQAFLVIVVTQIKLH